MVAKTMRFSVSARLLPHVGWFGNGFHPLFAASLKEHAKYDELWRCRPIVGIVDLMEEVKVRQKLNLPQKFKLESNDCYDAWFAHEFRMDEIAYSWDLDMINQEDETLKIQMEISSFMAGWPCSSQPTSFHIRAKKFLEQEYNGFVENTFKFPFDPDFVWSQLRISADQFVI